LKAHPYKIVTFLSLSYGINQIREAISQKSQKNIEGKLNG